MASHQELAGVSDQDFVLRMVNSHPERFDEGFWRYVDAKVAPHLPSNPRIVDLGCGPGLLVRDMGVHFSGADLHGFDLTPAMIDYANSDVEFAGARPNFGVLDLTKSAAPLEDHSVDLITMTAVLHVLDGPLETCAEILRLLAPNGLFLLSDWIRQPLAKYLEMMMASVPPERAEVMEKAMLRLSVAHNKYTIEDWLWLLDKGGLKVLDYAQIRAEHFCAFVCQAK
ncbi:MAG: SAM-dependent methyltransferase [Candidatus Azotimanducaceae bacterium]|jgi:SAM-dependent methyltransferase